MTAAQPNEPNAPNWQGSTAATAPQHGNRLAIASFILALVPLILGGLEINHVDVVGYVLVPLISAIMATRGSSTAIDIAGPALLIAYIAGILCSISGVVIGGLALGRARRYPPQQAGRGFAIAGVALGSLGILAFACVGFVAYSIIQFCSHGC